MKGGKSNIATVQAALAERAPSQRFLALRLVSRLALPKRDEELVAESTRVVFLPADGRTILRITVGEEVFETDLSEIHARPLQLASGGAPFVWSPGDTDGIDAALYSDLVATQLVESEEWTSVVNSLSSSVMTDLRRMVNRLLGHDDVANSEKANVDTVFVPGSQKEKIARKRNQIVDVDVAESLKKSINRLARVGSSQLINASVDALSSGDESAKSPVWIQGISFARAVERALGADSAATRMKRAVTTLRLSDAESKIVAEIPPLFDAAAATITALLSRFKDVTKKVVDEGAIEPEAADDDKALVDMLSRNHLLAVAVVAGEVAAAEKAVATALEVATSRIEHTAQTSRLRWGTEQALSPILKAIRESLLPDSAIEENDLSTAMSAIRKSAAKGANRLNEKVFEELVHGLGLQLANELKSRPFLLKDFVRRGGRSIDDLMEARPDDLRELLGVAGFEWGISAGSEKSKILLRAALSSWRDLADIIGVDDRALALDGRLVLSFGARGSEASHAKAFYKTQPDKSGAKIPLMAFTRDNGDGSFAHEMFHAMDFAGRDTPMIKEGATMPAVAAAARRLRSCLISCPQDEFLQRRARLIDETASEIADNDKILAELYEAEKAEAAKIRASRSATMERLEEEERKTWSQSEAALKKAVGGRLVTDAHGAEGLQQLALVTVRACRLHGGDDGQVGAQAVERVVSRIMEVPIGPKFRSRDDAKSFVEELVQSNLLHDLTRWVDAAVAVSNLNSTIKRQVELARHQLKIPARESYANYLKRRVNELRSEFAQAEKGEPLTSCRSSAVPRDTLAEIAAMDKGPRYPSSYIESAVMIDSAEGRKTAYYADNAEMSARAFEVFIADALRRAGRENAYLSKPWLMSRVDEASGGLFAYLTGAEKDRAMEAMGELLDALHRDRRPS